MAILSFEVPDDLLQAATAQAQAERRSRSEIAREALRRYLDAARNPNGNGPMIADE